MTWDDMGWQDTQVDPNVYDTKNNLRISIERYWKYNEFRNMKYMEKLKIGYLKKNIGKQKLF